MRWTNQYWIYCEITIGRYWQVRKFEHERILVYPNYYYNDWLKFLPIVLIINAMTSLWQLSLFLTASTTASQNFPSHNFAIIHINNAHIFFIYLFKILVWKDLRLFRHLRCHKIVKVYRFWLSMIIIIRMQ